MREGPILEHSEIGADPVHDVLIPCEVSESHDEYAAGLQLEA